MKILILGCGSIGKRHITNLKFLGYNDICVYDIDRELAVAVAKNYELPTVRSIAEGIDNKPDVAFICVPNHVHLSTAIPLAREGIHLFIEKPLDINLDNFNELSEIIVKNTIINMVGCNFRFDEGLKLVKNFLIEGQIGVPLILRAVFGYYLPDWRPGSDYRKNYAAKKETGGGVILDRIHEFDYVLWLLGNVSSISGFSRSTGSLDIETEDVADIVFKHTNGVISNIHIDYLRREYLCCCEVSGTEGIAFWNFKDRQVSLYKSDSKTWHHYSDQISKDINTMYVEEIKYFMCCVENEKQTCNTVFDAATTLQIAIDARERTL